MKLSPEFARFVFWLCVASCAAAQVAILASTLRGFRARRAGLTNSDDASAAATPELRRAPEFIWALLPAFALVWVFFGAWGTMTRTSDSGAEPQAPQTQPTLSGSASLLASHTLPPLRVPAKAGGTAKRAKQVPVQPISDDQAEPTDLDQNEYRQFEMHQ